VAKSITPVASQAGRPHVPDSNGAVARRTPQDLSPGDAAGSRTRVLLRSWCGTRVLRANDLHGTGWDTKPSEWAIVRAFVEVAERTETGHRKLQYRR
jgi:hypothetical protein